MTNRFSNPIRDDFSASIQKERRFVRFSYSACLLALGAFWGCVIYYFTH